MVHKIFFHVHCVKLNKLVKHYGLDPTKSSIFSKLEMEQAEQYKKGMFHFILQAMNEANKTV
jgi:hypothetical protein